MTRKTQVDTWISLGGRDRMDFVDVLGTNRDGNRRNRWGKLDGRRKYLEK